jgi:hypothetical protein
MRNSDKLHRAMRSLDEAIRYSRSSEYQGLGLEFKSVLQAAVVQNFSLTFKVCQDMIRYQLIDKHGEEQVNAHTPETLLHLAAEEGIIPSRDRWLEYLDCEHLSQTSTIPLRTFEKATDFLSDSGLLLQTCARRENGERRKAA